MANLKSPSCQLPPSVVRHIQSLLTQVPSNDTGQVTQQIFQVFQQHKIRHSNQIKSFIRDSSCSQNVKDLLLAFTKFCSGDRAQALQALPNHLAWNNNWFFQYFNARCHIDLRRFSDAKPAIDRGLTINPEQEDLWHLLGVYYIESNAPEQARDAYQKSLSLNPNRDITWNNLGVALEQAGDLEGALRASQKASELSPNKPELKHNFAYMLSNCGETLKANAIYEDLVKNSTFRAESLSCYFYNQLFNDDSLSQATKEQNLAFARDFSERYTGLDIKCKALDGRPLRVGYLSGDFYRHSCAFFIAPLLKNHTDNVYSICFSDGAITDKFTKHLSSLPNEWIETNQINNEELVKLVRSKNVDVLIDLAGHTSNSRLPALCQRLAPIQVNYLGFAGSTWLPSMDYRLVDWHSDPKGADENASESLVRLPETFLAYEPLLGAPPIEAPPFQANKYITFGSFNNPVKTSDRTLQTWSRILQKVPNSRICFKAILFRHEQIKNAFRARLASHGIAPSNHVYVVIAYCSCPSKTTPFVVSAC